MAEPIRIIIVDDETHARQRIEQLLAQEPDFQVIAVADNGHDAEAAILSHEPDVVFLDIEIPDRNGFAVLTSVTRIRPLVVFVTAYEEYSIKAWQEHAVDYLVKPYTRARFARALDVVRERVALQRKSALADRLVATYGQLRPASPEVVVVRTGRRVERVALEQIEWVQARGNYLELNLRSRQLVMRDSIAGFVARFSRQFVRIHRSSAVRLDAVRQLRIDPGQIAAVLDAGVELIVARRYGADLRRRFGQAARYPTCNPPESPPYLASGR